MLQLAQAGVIAPPLDQHCLEFDARIAGQKGEVFLDQLLLQINGVSGDDHPLVVAYRPEDRRNQVGQGLAGAGARLDQCHPVTVEGFGHLAGHTQLFAALLVPLQVGHHTVRCENSADFPGGQQLPLLFAERGNHQVTAGSCVVDDAETDPLIAADRGDLHVGGRGFEGARWMVVDDDIAAGGAGDDGRYGDFGAAGYGLCFIDHAVHVAAADKENLVAPGGGYFVTHE